MGRKKIEDLKFFKFSFDVQGENKNILDRICEAQKLKYGPALNKIIFTLCRIPKPIREGFTDYCKHKIKELNNQLSTVGSFQQIELKNQISFYEEFVILINEGDSSILENRMKIKDGYVVFPEDWIVLNPEEASECMYAGVVEFRNHHRYNIPHFLFFTNYKYGRDYTDEFQDKIQKLCQEKWEPFTSFLAKEVELIENPKWKENEEEPMYLNIEEYNNGVSFGMFHFHEEDDPLLPDNYEHPFNARIIRN